MSKKKKKNKKSEFNYDLGQFKFDSKFSSKLDKQYQEIIGDIEDIQYKIYLADKKKQKKQKKKMKKGKINFYEPKDKKVRLWAIDEITGDKIFKTIKNIFEDLKPIVVIISKLLMALIVSILSLDVIKEKISNKALERIDTLYKLCASVA